MSAPSAFVPLPTSQDEEAVAASPMDEPSALQHHRERSIFKRLGAWKTSIPPAVSYHTPSIATPRPRVALAAFELARRFPELVAAIDCLGDVDSAPSTVPTVTATYDAAVGDLLAFGSIACRGLPDRHVQPVVALPSGEAGNMLRLQTLTMKRRGWPNDQSTWLNVSSMAGGQAGFWSETAAPIQQLCFSPPGDQGSLLAVRLPRRTVLLQPKLCGACGSAGRSGPPGVPSSAVKIHPIADITVHETGGVAHADVSFCSSIPPRVGVVDREGDWSIWSLAADSSKNTFTISCETDGSLCLNSQNDPLLEPQDEPHGTTAGSSDGWARILWVGVDTVLVCDRRRVGVYLVRPSSSPVELQCPDLLLEHSPAQFLDVKKHPSNADQCFVLTSSRLLLLAVHAPSASEGLDNYDTAVTILVSWPHFLSVQDHTLQLCPQSLSDAESLVLVHSRLNTLITAFRTAKHSFTPALPLSGSTAHYINSDGLIDVEKRQRIAGLHLGVLPFDVRTFDSGSPSGKDDFSSDVNFFRLSVLLSDLSVRQAIFACSNGVLEQSDRAYMLAGPPSKVIRFQQSYHLQQSHHAQDHLKAKYEEEDEEFYVTGLVVSDDEAVLPMRGARSLYTSLEQSTPRSEPVPKGLCDYRLLYNALTSRDPSSAATPDAIDLSLLTDEVRRLLVKETSALDALPATMLDFVGRRIDASDIDEVSTKLQELFAEKSIHNLHEVQPSVLHNVLREGQYGHGPPTAASVYESLLHNFIASLPETVGSRVRMFKEVLARKIAVEVLLASMLVRRPDGSPISKEPQQFARALKNPPSSAPFTPPTPSHPSSTLSLTVSQEDQHAPSSRLSADTDRLASLRKHLWIEPSVPTISASNTRQILGRWQADEEPGTFRWDGIDHETGAASPSEGGRHKPKQPKESTEMGDVDQITVRRGMPASSPVRMFGLSSSQVASQSQSMPFGGLVVQSQVEQGRHGGRPVKRRKAQSSMKGF